MGTNSTAVGIAFAVATFISVAGGLIEGEAKSFDSEAACNATTWPFIPQVCLKGGSGNSARLVRSDEESLPVNVR